MWSTNKKDRCLRIFVLALNCAACIATVFIYLVSISKEQKLHANASVHNHVQAEKMTDERCVEVCNSSACILHASIILKNMHSTVDPCENFDYFLCDGFKEKYGFEEKGHFILEHMSPLLNKVKSILDNIEAEPQSASGKMKIVYDTCINYGTSDLRGFEDIKAFYSNLGVLNWPYLPVDLNFNHTGLPVLFGNLIGNGAIGYVNLSPNPAYKDAFQLHFSKWNFETTTEIPQKAAIYIMKYFDLDPVDVESIINDHQLVRESIISLYERYESCEDECKGIHHIDCSGDENNDWRDICETAQVALQLLRWTDEVDTASLFVKKSELDFWKNLFPLLDSLADRSIANFLVLNFISQHQDELSFYFRLSKLKNNQFQSEEEKLFYQVDRWKYCARWITKNMKMPIINEFIHEFLTREVTEEMIDFYKDYLSTITEMVAEQRWIPTEIKLDIENDIKDITFNVIALKETFPNDTFVNGMYEKFHPNSESFIDNAMKLGIHSRKLLVSLFSSQMGNKWNAIFGTEFDVQASRSESSDLSEIVVHYGLLVPPFYIPGYDKLSNRILMGSYIVHEVGHYLHAKLATTLEDDSTFLEKEECVRDQFSRFKFQILNEKMNGSVYNGENMPDNLATAVIDKIIENYSENEQSILPGLSYTTKQLLYIIFNQFHCSKSNLEEEMQHYEGLQTHALSQFRIIGMMQNSRGFSEAFRCANESFMNTQEKCLLLETY